ncbi:MAG: DUF1538 domain-containing protein [Acidobacteria bacterium]|nr:MAG: DUF1538 domain-containing protein [Acidobacteriota bacterium]REK02864.1 MAG: DUF1538 domain-containing protein [Acidobacteriota bacterium]REK13332.1 MAG: DUF1538 domain-containing protein [Acidobacteriota bacterium]REK41326.1 MAG: DUF1538 domain-containing protein [Acidobacteriota bacterium]
MTEFLGEFLQILILTVRDVLPILMLIVFFQLVVLRQPIPNLKKIIVGGIYVVLGLSLFLLGLEKALFPVGELMATQLSGPEFVGSAGIEGVYWLSYSWIFVFAAMVGFATTIAEPALIAVAMKANEVSAGTISQWGLRITVALGVAFALALGTFRIVTGTPLHLYILVGYIIVIVQTVFAPKKIIALAYDSGGVTTSTVTVPLVAALGLGLSSSVPGRNPAIDGFGLIAFASLFPIISVLAYAQLAELSNFILKKTKQ